MEENDMSNEFQNFDTTPTLTLDPFQAQEEKKPLAPEPEQPVMDESILSDEERRMVDSFAQQIDLTNSALVLQYGAGTQKKMADFSESALENVRSKDLGVVGELFCGVVFVVFVFFVCFLVGFGWCCGWFLFGVGCCGFFGGR